MKLAAKGAPRKNSAFSLIQPVYQLKLMLRDVLPPEPSFFRPLTVASIFIGTRILNAKGMPALSLAQGKLD